MRLRRGDPVLVSPRAPAFRPQARSPRQVERRRRHNRHRVQYRLRLAARSRDTAQRCRGAWPGTIHAGPRTLRPSIVTSTMSPFDSPYSLGSRRTYADDIVPGDLGQRLRQLLQPGNIGEAAIPNASDRAGRRPANDCRQRRFAVVAAGLWLTMAAACAAVPLTNPSCSELAQRASKSAPNASRQVARTAASGSRITGPEQHSRPVDACCAMHRAARPPAG